MGGLKLKVMQLFAHNISKYQHSDTTATQTKLW